MNQNRMYSDWIAPVIRHHLQEGDRLAAIRETRQWMVDTGRGDDYPRAKQMVELIAAEMAWVQDKIRRTK